MLFNKKANTVGNWENGKTEPSIPELLVISGYFGVNLEDLLRSEMRQQQLDMERQLSLWPDAVEKQAGIPQAVISTEPAGAVGSARVLEPARGFDPARPEPAGVKPARLTEPVRPVEPARPGNTYINEMTAPQRATGLPPAQRVDSPAPGTETAPAGDAIWFMLRELRSVQERLDRLQSAFDQSRAYRPADKSDH